MAYDGVEIFSNGSGSYTELRKDYLVADLVKMATAKVNNKPKQIYKLTSIFFYSLAAVTFLVIYGVVTEAAFISLELHVLRSMGSSSQKRKLIL